METKPVMSNDNISLSITPTEKKNETKHIKK